MQDLEKILEEIEQAKREPWYRLNNYDVRHKLDGAINRIVDIIRKHMNDGWISVDDRLPEVFGKYWATIRYNDGRISEPVVVDFRGVRKKYVVDTPNGREYETWGIDTAFHGSRVIAWRPYHIPEPYRPERSEGRMKYRCINEFYIEIYDEGWMPTGEYKTIPVGTIWELDEFTNNIGGEVHLDNDDEGWIEISRETLEECFEEVRE